MSMQDYETAVFLMNQHPEKMDFCGPRPESLVREAEQALGLNFSPIYRRFLLEFGAGNFGAEEIYGVTHSNFTKSAVPNGIWMTLKSRKETKYPLPDNLIVIANDGTGIDFCLRHTTDGLEPRVITFIVGIPAAQQRPELIAEDFGQFFLERVQFELWCDEEEQKTMT